MPGAGPSPAAAAAATGGGGGGGPGLASGSCDKNNNINDKAEGAGAGRDAAAAGTHHPRRRRGGGGRRGDTRGGAGPYHRPSAAGRGARGERWAGPPPRPSARRRVGSTTQPGGGRERTRRRAPRSVPAGRGEPPRRRKEELPCGGNGTCHRSNGRRSQPSRLRAGSPAVNPSVPATRGRLCPTAPSRSGAREPPTPRGGGLPASAPAPQRNPGRRAEAQLRAAERGGSVWLPDRRGALRGRPGSAGLTPPPPPPAPSGSSALTQCGGRPGTGARAPLRAPQPAEPPAVPVGGAAGGVRRGRAPPAPGALCSKKTRKGVGSRRRGGPYLTARRPFSQRNDLSGVPAAATGNALTAQESPTCDGTGCQPEGMREEMLQILVLSVS